MQALVQGHMHRMPQQRRKPYCPPPSPPPPLVKHLRLIQQKQTQISERCISYLRLCLSTTSAVVYAGHRNYDPEKAKLSKVLPFKVWRRSEHSLARFACYKEFCLSSFRLLGSFNFAFSILRCKRKREQWINSAPHDAFDASILSCDWISQRVPRR